MYSQQESLCELESEVEKREEEVIQLQQQLACMTIPPTSTSMLSVDLLQAKVGLIMTYMYLSYKSVSCGTQMYMQQIASIYPNTPYTCTNT